MQVRRGREANLGGALPEQGVEAGGEGALAPRPEVQEEGGEKQGELRPLPCLRTGALRPFPQRRGSDLRPGGAPQTKPRQAPRR